MEEESTCENWHSTKDSSSFHRESHVDMFGQLSGTVEYLLGGGFMFMVY